MAPSYAPLAAAAAAGPPVAAVAGQRGPLCRLRPCACGAGALLALALAAGGLRPAAGGAAPAARRHAPALGNATGSAGLWSRRGLLGASCARSAGHQQRCIFHSHPSCSTGRRPADQLGAFSVASGADMCRIQGGECPAQRQLGAHGACDPSRGSELLLPGHPKAVLTITNMYWTDACDLVTRCGPVDAEEVLAAMLSSGYHEISGACEDVVQCVHHPDSVSRGWIHMHTVCSGGCVDGLPGTGGAGPSVGNGWCVSGSHSSKTKAAELLAWISDACHSSR